MDVIGRATASRTGARVSMARTRAWSMTMGCARPIIISAAANPMKTRNEKRWATMRQGTEVTSIHPVERERTGIRLLQIVEMKNLAQDHGDAKHGLSAGDKVNSSAWAGPRVGLSDGISSQNIVAPQAGERCTCAARGAASRNSGASMSTTSCGGLPSGFTCQLPGPRVSFRDTRQR